MKIFPNTYLFNWIDALNIINFPQQKTLNDYAPHHLN